MPISDLGYRRTCNDCQINKAAEVLLFFSVQKKRHPLLSPYHEDFQVLKTFAIYRKFRKKQLQPNGASPPMASNCNQSFKFQDVFKKRPASSS